MTSAYQWKRDLLARWVSKESGKPFAWGVRDCSTWALVWLALVTGDATVCDLLGEYRDEAGAREFAAQYGRDLRQIFADAGAFEVLLSEAAAGDVVLVRELGDPWWRGHVCLGHLFAAPWPGRGVRTAHMAIISRLARQGAQVVALRLLAPDGGEA